jgi:hypothetical protein
MMSRAAGTALGVLFLACVGLPALSDEAIPERRPAHQQAFKLPEPRDLGDGPRFPLSELGARFGIIVTVVDENVHIIHRDGSELRLRASSPGERPLELGKAEILVSNADVWARAKDVPRLLGLPGTLDADAREMTVSLPPDEAQPVETFLVAKPVVLSAPRKRGQTARARRPRPDSRAGRDSSGLVTEVMTGDTSLGVSHLSLLNSPGMTGVYQQVTRPASSDAHRTSRDLDPQSPVRHTVAQFSMEMHEEDRVYAAGDVFDPLCGTATGFEMRTAVNEDAWIGAAVLVPNDSVREDAEGQVSLRAAAPVGPHVSTDLAVSLDGSYSLSGQWRRGSTALRSSILDRADLSRRDVSVEHQIARSIRGYARSSELQGLYGARADLLGAEWRLGKARLALERTRGVSGDEVWGTDAVSMSLLRGRSASTIRYLVPREADGRSGLEWFVSRFHPSGRQVFFSSSAPSTGTAPTDRTYRVGTSWPVGQGLRLRAALGWDSEELHPEAKMEWRPSRDKVITLQYGPFDMDASGGALDTAIVLQASMAFGGTAREPHGTGRVVGQVRDDSGQGVGDVAVVLEEVTVTFTRSDGTFEFRGVKPGRQIVKIDDNRLHADLGGQLRPRVVFVSENGTESADFVVTRLCRISGGVYVRSADGTLREPLPDAVVQLSDGRLARTNSQGRYSFVGLGPGRYTVSLASSMDVSTLRPLAPTSWSFRLQPGDEVDGADFTFERRERPVIFGFLTTEQ